MRTKICHEENALKFAWVDGIKSCGLHIKRVTFCVKFCVNVGVPVVCAMSIVAYAYRAWFEFVMLNSSTTLLNVGYHHVAKFC